MRNWLTPTAAVVINYTFDRLTHTDYTGGSTIDYTYDVMGNRLTQNSNIGAIGNTSYGYATNNRLTSLNGSATGLAYDANGNMTSRRINNVTWTQTYDFENRLTQASSTLGTWSFTYDGDGNRVKQVAANGDVTAYVGGVYEVTYSSTGMLKNTKLYYTLGAQVVAMRDVSGSGGTLYYLHGDNLGSASLTTNASAAVVSQNKYYPFGASRLTQGTRPTDLDFTGQRLDGTGLHFYNARYYDSVLGRFVSADTMVPDPTSSQLYNRYAYAINNPARYTDPTGHCGPLTPVCVGLAVLGAAYAIGRVGFEVAASIPDSWAYRSTRDVIGGALVTDVSEVITAQAAQHSVDSSLISAVIRHESAAGERRIWTLLPLSQPGALADVFETVEAYARQDTFGRPASIGPGQMQLRRAIELEALGYVTPRTSDRDRIQALLGKESSVEYVAGMLHYLSDQLNTLPGFNDLSQEEQQRLILIGYNWGWTDEFQNELLGRGLKGMIDYSPYDEQTLDEYLRWSE